MLHVGINLAFGVTSPTDKSGGLKEKGKTEEKIVLAFSFAFHASYAYR